MSFTRRNWMAGAAGLSLLPRGHSAVSSVALPLKAEFPVSETCLNNARWHPISNGARRAVQEYFDYKASGGGSDPEYGTRIQTRVKEEFAGLINAHATEISFVPSTSVGENLAASALGLPAAGGNIVTDALHFEGSLYLYGELQKKGMDVRIVRPKNWRIELSDLEKVIDRNTKLVAVSLVSMLNGFEHDLKAVCEIAHASGAYVYADIVQAAGAVPIDVRASGVDFCSCASYKWLMGDMGLGFLYVRQDLLDRLKRSQYGYRQLDQMQYHLFPYDSPGSAIFDWTVRGDAAGHFEIGTISNTTIACLSHSLPLIRQLGVENIQAHRQPLVARIQKELPRFGFEPLTPPESKSSIVAFAMKDTQPIARKLKHAHVDIAVYPGRVRISPSIYNDQKDVDRLLESLS